ncbi:hypothetical protein D3C86_1566340 [compost metagenome]
MGQQVEPVVFPLDLADSSCNRGRHLLCGLIRDPKCFNTHILIVTQPFVEVVQAIVGPGYVGAKSQEVSIRGIRLIAFVGVANIDWRLVETRFCQVPGHSGQWLVAAARREVVTQVTIGNLLT